jgi:sec-independent protein translocase protein TatA
MFGNIGATELIIILVIVLVLFGARKVPEIGASIGKGIREFKRNISDVDKQVRSTDETRERDRDRLSAGSPNMNASAEDEEARPEPRRLI